MRMLDIIIKKRNALPLNQEEFNFIAQGAAKGTIPDYQLSAFLMAAFANPLSDKETALFTKAMANSGDRLNFKNIKMPKTDKHSTGGVGDGISIPLAPLVACAGVAVPMMSGRGLGHTGGTLDKLESIKNFNVRTPVKQIYKQIKEIGVCMFGQTADLAPADKKLYSLINDEIKGKVAIKLHTGERNGPNILPREMVKAFQQSIPNSNIVETNTLYIGDRDTTEKHRKTLEVNGWTFCPVDIMDEEGTVMLPVKGGKHFKEVSMGKNIVNYDSMVVLTHFKGHAMGGFGGSMKNIAIGCADGKIGKAQVHAVKDINAPWDEWPAKEHLMETMAESAKAVCDHFDKHIVFINVMRRMSVDCDCAGLSAAEPTIPDIGMVASTDILAIDQACVDLVYSLGKDKNHDLVERIESRHGLRQLSYMHELGMGKANYELVDIDI